MKQRSSQDTPVSADAPFLPVGTPQGLPAPCGDVPNSRVQGPGIILAWSFAFFFLLSSNLGRFFFASSGGFFLSFFFFLFFVIPFHISAVPSWVRLYLIWLGHTYSARSLGFLFCVSAHLVPLRRPEHAISKVPLGLHLGRTPSPESRGHDDGFVNQPQST